MKFLIIAIITTVFLRGTETEWEVYKTTTLLCQHEVVGWCTQEKAKKMMDLIYEKRPLVCVEIGVFGGSSIYPTAEALKYIDQGVVYAIDPWTKENCQEGYDPIDPNYIWWSSIDLEKIYQGFLSLLEKHQLTKFCTPMKLSSEDASIFFTNESIDILHIDGNHTSEISLSDVELWLPKVKQGGYIWFTNVNWISRIKAVTYLNERCSMDFSRSIEDSCWLFKKI